MLRATQALMAAAILATFGCSNSPAPPSLKQTSVQGEPSISGPKPAAILLELAGAPKQKRDDFQVTLRVTNPSAQNVGWDRHWAAFLKWNLRSLEDRRVFREILPDRVAKDVSVDRFVLIEPGKSLTHEFKLSRQIRILEYEPLALDAPGLRPVEVPAFSEVWARFRAAKSIPEINVQVTYWPGFKSDDVFERFFSFSRSTVKMWGHKVDSNVLTIRFE
jgi:hypothetical protein